MTTELSKVKLELNPWYMVNEDRRRFEFLDYLGHVDEICVVENQEIRSRCIVVNGRVLAVVDPYDDWEFVHLGDYGAKPPIIFKYQWCRAGDYPPGTISAGYPCVRNVPCPADLLTRNRPIDFTARMRCNHDYRWGVDVQWMVARSLIVEEAERLGRAGYSSRWGFVPGDQYVSELWDAQIGFDWRGAGYLTHRMIEYIRAGVVPITRPFGKEWPVREDVILEDGIHCVVCLDPTQFAHEAKLLVADKAKIEKIRRNLLKLWQEKLCPVAQGYWIWGKLKAALALQQDGALRAS
jgi:hypothetical protein